LQNVHPRHRRYALIGVVCAVALFAAACGSNKSDSSSGTTPSTGASSNITIAASGDPTPGGKLVFGLEAESDGFNPTVNRWAISGTEIGLAVFDPLVAFDANGQWAPYLAQSLTPNADYTVWTITVRPDIKFQNGTPLTGAAIETMFKAHLASALTRPALGPMTGAKATGELTCEITMKTPWVTFPTSLTSQIGMVPAPSMFDADGKGTEAGQRAPVGTGPFVFKSWEPDKAFNATKNAGYWRKDAQGNALPYLDEIEFRPIPDGDTRTQALLTGDINELHSSDFNQIVKYRAQAKDGKLQLVEDNGESEEDILIINTQDPAMSDVRVRKAMALATDKETFNKTINAGIGEIADGVFKPTSKWYVKTDYPNFDKAAAQKLVADYTAEKGSPPTFTLGTTPSPINQLAVQSLQSMYNEVGMKVSLKTTEQASFIADAVTGKYQVNLWRQFGAVDPDADALWWYSANAEGGLTLNIARNKDASIDAGLDKGRTSTDEATRKDGYATLQQGFAKDVPYVWLNHALWAVVAGNNVRGITNGPLPDGQPSLPIGGGGDFGGVVRYTQTWLQQ